MRSVTILAKDGFSLSATLHGNSNRSVVIVNSATAVPQRYYQPFAQWLAEAGHTVITYDYRGIGGSRPEGSSLRGFKATMEDWAIQDAAGVLDWAVANFPKARLTMIGHSFGGQALGLLPNHAKIHQAILVSAQEGYWKLFDKKVQPRLWLLWHVVAPTLCATMGYFPAKRLGLGENLPKGVMLQWARWCRQEGYYFAEAGKGLQVYADQVKIPILAYVVKDDTFAPKASAKGLIDRFTQARPDIRLLDPAALGVREIGHFGLFRERFRDSVWAEMRDWINRAR